MAGTNGAAHGVGDDGGDSPPPGMAHHHNHRYIAIASFRGMPVRRVDRGQRGNEGAGVAARVGMKGTRGGAAGGGPLRSRGWRVT